MAGSFLDTSYDDWEQILDVNLWGVIRGSLAFGRLMVDNGEVGHITPEIVVDAVLRAVDGDWPLMPVATEAHLGLFSQRFMPRLRRAIARIDLTPPPSRHPDPSPARTR